MRLINELKNEVRDIYAILNIYQTEIVINGNMNIALYNTELIEIRDKSKVIKVTGKNLLIKEMKWNQFIINGHIEKVTYINE